MSNSNKARNILIFTVCIIVLLIIIALAAFKSSDDSKINNNLDVKITNVISRSIKGEAENIEEPIFTDNEVKFKPSLKTKDDSITYDITITNNSNVNTYVDTIDIDHSKDINYKIKGFAEDDIILPKHTATLSIKAKYNESEKVDTKLNVKLEYSK